MDELLCQARFLSVYILGEVATCASQRLALRDASTSILGGTAHMDSHAIHMNLKHSTPQGQKRLSKIIQPSAWHPQHYTGMLWV
jgi:hypothetical protein